MNVIKATIMALTGVCAMFASAFAKPYSKAKLSDESWLEFDVKDVSSSILKFRLGKVQAAKTWLDVKKATSQLEPIEDGSARLLNVKLKKYHEQVSWLVGEGNQLSSFGACLRVNQRNGILTAHCVGTALPTGIVSIAVIDVATNQVLTKAELSQFKIVQSTKDLTRGFLTFDAKLTKVDESTVLNKNIVLVFPESDSPSVDREFKDDLPKTEAIYSQFAENFYRSRMKIRSDADTAAYFEYSCACKVALDTTLHQISKPLDCRLLSDNSVCSVFYYKILNRWFEVSRNKLN